MARLKTKFDVIVVGGGPAGSTAAYLLSKYNLQVLLLDKANFPRLKLCGGLLTNKTIKLIKAIFKEKESLLIKNQIINFQANSYEVFYQDKSLLKRRLTVPFYFVDRKIFDYFLLKKAKKAGANIKINEQVKTVDLLRNTVITTKGNVFSSKFIIGADGVNSIVRGELIKRGYIKADNWLSNLATGMEIFIDRPKIKEKINHPIIFFGLINWGYAWVFPNKYNILIGLGGLNSKNKGKILNVFNNFLSLLQIEAAERKKIIGHLIPYGSFLKKPIYKNILLAGDAAGLVDPITGEGIYYAIKSGELAAKAINQCIKNRGDVEQLYLFLLRKDIYPKLIFRKKIRFILFQFFNKMHYYLFKITLRLMDQKIIEFIHGV